MIISNSPLNGITYLKLFKDNKHNTVHPNTSNCLSTYVHLKTNETKKKQKNIIDMKKKYICSRVYYIQIISGAKSEEIDRR